MAGQSIPNYQVGRNCAAFIGADLYIDSGGNIVTGNATDFHPLGILDQFEYSIRNGNVEISALDAFAENNLPTKVSFQFSVGELKQTSGQSKLANLAFNQTTLFGFEAVVIDPSTGNGSILSMVGRIDELGDGMMEGKNVTKITCVTAGLAPYYNTFSGGASSAPAGGLSSGNIRTGHFVTSSK